jgi:hypothetical protein
MAGTDHRIVGHLTLCFLAYFCEAQLTQTLREKRVTLQKNVVAQTDFMSLTAGI